MFNREEMRASVPDFLELYAERPLPSNSGGMGLNHSWAVWFLLTRLRPTVVVESGVFKGHSTWLIEQSVPHAEVYSFDINLAQRAYVSPKVRYSERDFTRADWSGVDTSNAVCFFDDHQNAYERLVHMAWFGFTRAIIEDNWPVGEGDNYSLKHVMAGTGAPSLQMSAAYAGGSRERRRRRKREELLWTMGPRQDFLVEPNGVDAANLRRQLAHYEEMPPLRLDETTIWGTGWEGAYQSVEELVPDLELDGVDLSYSFLAFVELKNKR